jgi:hypothetical protein
MISKNLPALIHTYGEPLLRFTPREIDGYTKQELIASSCPTEIAIFKLGKAVPYEYVVWARLHDQDEWLPNCSEQWAVRELIQLSSYTRKYLKEIAEQPLVDFIKKNILNKCSRHSAPASSGMLEYHVSISEAARVCSESVKSFIEDFSEWASINGYKVVRSSDNTALWTKGEDTPLTTKQLRALYYKDAQRIINANNT